MLFLSVTLGVPLPEVSEWPSALITLYQVYYKISPWGEFRSDVRNAQLLAQTANMHRDIKKQPQPYPITDFMPFLEKDEPDEPKQSTKQFRTSMRAATKMSKR